MEANHPTDFKKEIAPFMSKQIKTLDQADKQQHGELNTFESGMAETYEDLKNAILELYLSVKIRSDEEIDNYTEEQFQEEKKEMKHVDGYSLIDYIK